MRNKVIYTGFVVPPGLARLPQELLLEKTAWVRKSFDIMQRYADHIGADVRYIDHSHAPFTEYMDRIFESVPGIGPAQRQAMCYSSLFAILDFVSSSYEQMYWLDADLTFLHFNVDIFDFWRPGLCLRHDIIERKKLADWNQPSRSKWHGTEVIVEARGLRNCSSLYSFDTSIFSLDRDNAERLVAEIDLIDFRSLEYWSRGVSHLHKVVTEKTIDFRFDDESYLAALVAGCGPGVPVRSDQLNSSPLYKLERWNLPKSRDSILYDLEEVIASQSFLVHFRGYERKPQILELYERIDPSSVNNSQESEVRTEAPAKCAAECSIPLKDLLLTVFAADETGHAVQIGAHTGQDLFKQFLKQRPGFHAILVEPVSHLFEELKRNYPQSLFPSVALEKLAISNAFQIRSFYTISEEINALAPEIAKKFPFYDQLGSFERHHLCKHADGLLDDFVSEQKVTCVPLQALMDKHNLPKLDLLFVDAEGYDGEILMQVSLDRYSPKVIVFEHKHLSEHTLDQLEVKFGPGYLKKKFGQNSVYLRRDISVRLDDAISSET